MKSTGPATKAGEKALFRLKQWHGEHQIVVGLSGGVDSSLTAAFLVEAGWQVEGLTLWLMSGKGSCCSDGLVDAAGVCEQLEIPHHVMDSRATFRAEIIDGLVKGYQEGITPIPCSRCNRSVKFGPMLKWAQENRNIQRIATGHYARIRFGKPPFESSLIKKNSPERTLLLRGLDLNKDQSYFLYDLSQEVLSKIVFPLGELTKLDTRKEANRLGLRTAKKAESQDLCLAEHHGSMKAFLDTYLPSRPGKIVLIDGTEVGVHDGIEHFTIGQRKGLGVSWREPLHVIKIESESNQVVVAPRAQAGCFSCIVGEVNWISIDPPQEAIKVEVQVRYRSQPVFAELIPIKPTNKDTEKQRPHRCQICFDEEQFSIAPGQAAVFYSGEIVLGGGIIQPES
ncbi:tRNA 2-thiouridine(34) synthase MnmA [Prochlorococcus sp. MIT 1307]|uniref:tRNA 2-thiouridine(34) synthase MnmA n=1 Tax=Prochlorococcus sp. MIT 1307 TaxID=3096219 RepID=UPI002A75279A|nr:tRNA 2-thiouridine(34) synthase MnmA [Prochlorococcus sp. MIT 1307]